MAAADDWIAGWDMSVWDRRLRRLAVSPILVIEECYFECGFAWFVRSARTRDVLVSGPSRKIRPGKAQLITVTRAAIDEGNLQSIEVQSSSSGSGCWGG